MRMVGPQSPGCFAQVLAQQGTSRRQGYQRCKKNQARDQQILLHDSQHIKTLLGAVLRKGLNTELIAQPIFICWFLPTGSSLASSLWRGQELVTIAPRRGSFRVPLENSSCAPDLSSRVFAMNSPSPMPSYPGRAPSAENRLRRRTKGSPMRLMTCGAYPRPSSEIDTTKVSLFQRISTRTSDWEKSTAF